MSSLTDDRPQSAVELSIGGMTCASCANRIERSSTSSTASPRPSTTPPRRPRSPYADGVDRRRPRSPTVEKTGYTAALPAAAGRRRRADGPTPTRRARAAAAAADRLASCSAVPVIAMAMIPALQFTDWQWLSLPWPRRSWCGAPGRSTGRPGPTCATARRRWTRCLARHRSPRSAGRCTRCSSATRGHARHDAPVRVHGRAAPTARATSTSRPPPA